MSSSTSLTETWEKVLSDLEKSLSPKTVRVIIRPNVAISDYSDNKLTLVSYSGFGQQITTEYYGKELREAVKKNFGPKTKVRLINKKTKKPKEKTARKKREGQVVISSSKNLSGNSQDIPILRKENNYSEQLKTALLQSQLNSRYRLDSLVVGDHNQLAFAAAQAVSRNPGTTYNPLFVWGGVGLGKTHLIQAIGHEMLKKDPSRKVYYSPSETFLNAFVECIRAGKGKQFRDKYRSVDLLILDDVQFMSTWEKCKTELFHTFNQLYQSNKQILLASDRPPQELGNVEERLKSRFAGGMVVQIYAPDIETRLAILKKKQGEMKIILPDNVHMYIARNIVSNVRELEGAYTKVAAQYRLSGVVPSEERVKQILKIDINSKRKRISPQKIIKSVTDEFSISVKEVKSKSRKAEITLPRQVCMYVIKEELEFSFDKVAKELNRSDHTTAMHACEKVEKLIEEDKSLQEKIDNIRMTIERTPSA